jgi:hypothetical protein
VNEYCGRHPWTNRSLSVTLPDSYQHQYRISKSPYVKLVQGNSNLLDGRVSSVMFHAFRSNYSQPRNKSHSNVGGSLRLNGVHGGQLPKSSPCIRDFQSRQNLPRSRLAEGHYYVILKTSYLASIPQSQPISRHKLALAMHMIHSK